MARFQPVDFASDDNPPEQWTATDYVLAVLARTGLREMPAPMPLGMDAAAAWWLGQMCETRSRDEDEQSFGRRCAFALNGWLMLNKAQRTLVVNLVADGFAYRGDRMDAFVAVCEETETMREMGANKYREHAVTAMRDCVGRIQLGAS